MANPAKKGQSGPINTQMGKPGNDLNRGAGSRKAADKRGGKRGGRSRY